MRIICYHSIILSSLLGLFKFSTLNHCQTCSKCSRLCKRNVSQFQLLLSETENKTAREIEDCNQDISTWVYSNHLKLNDDRT